MNIANEIDELDRLLLSNIKTVFPQPLTPEERVSLRAFIVLSHAVLEEFLEDFVIGYFDEASISLASAHPTKPAVRLIYAITRQFPQDQLNADTPFVKVTEITHPLVKAVVDANHGIKTTNIKKLFQSVGINWADVDSKFTSELADLNTLGSRRGEAGHLSPFTEKTIQLTESIDPEDARAWVSNARQAMETIDSYVTELLRPPGNVAIRKIGHASRSMRVRFV